MLLAMLRAAVHFLFMNLGDIGWTDTMTLDKRRRRFWCFQWIPYAAGPGDAMRIRCEGRTIDWWDWGTREDHADTTVVLPCFIYGRVMKPFDNDGRPELVIPTSNTVEFSIVEEKAV